MMYWQFRWSGNPIGTTFRANTVVATFDEFKYFTGAAIPVNAFRGCSNLRVLNCQNYSGTLTNSVFAQAGMVYLRFKRVSIHGSGGADDGAFYAMPNLLGIWFEELTNAGIGGMYNAHSHYNIITNNYVATAGSMTRYYGVTYVPDELVSSYQGTSGWSSKTIRALSTLPTYAPDCPWIDDLRQRGFIS